MKEVKRVAILHDWLLTWRGGEKCLELIKDMFEDVEIFTLFLDKDIKNTYFESSKIHTGLLNSLPYVPKYYRSLLPLFPMETKIISRRLMEEHKKKPFDVVISINHCAVKNIETPNEIPHLCYCLTPVRYIWDQYDRYLSDKWYEPLLRPLRFLLQKWDIAGSKNVSTYIAISEYISDRIRRVYGRESVVVYPPVETEERKGFNDVSVKSPDEEPYFLVVNALVPYKNTKLIIEAFKSLPYQLKIVGSGPEGRYLKSISNSNISFLGRVSDDVLHDLYNNCLSLIYAAEEDFGIVPVEAQAHGKPVICYASGGCLETVVFDGVNKTGRYFYELSADSLKGAVHDFIENPDIISAKDCIENSRRFSRNNFLQSFQKVFRESLKDSGFYGSSPETLKFGTG